MCGRYELHTHPAAIALAFGLSAPPALRPRYNIAPMQPVPIVRQNYARDRVLSEVGSGVVRRWLRAVSIRAGMTHARAPPVADHAAYRCAFRGRRCLLAAGG